MANDGTLTPEQIDAINLQLSNQKEILRQLNAMKASDVDLTEKQVELYDKSIEKVLSLSKKLRENKKAQEEANEAKKAAAKEISDYNKKIDETTKLFSDLIPGLDKAALLFKKNEKGMMDGKAAADAFLSSMVKFAVALEETNVKLAQQTGYATALQENVRKLASTHDGLYLSMSESAEVVGALSTGFRMYNAQNKQTQTQVDSLAGRFVRLGADASQTATVLDQMNVIFGGMTSGAIAATAELENLAIRTGQPLAAVLSDFQDLGPQMARFGVDGVRVFTRLNEQARTLGLTTRQAFDISELFDTFESSADVAGKLNAQLGLQLNSVELMTASSEDRLKILRAEFDMAGVSMQQMGRRQKQMIADILKTDVMTAERLLGDPMAMRKFQREQENNEERVKKFTTAMDKFRAASEEIFIKLSPFILKILGALNVIADVVATVTAGPFGDFVASFAVLGSILFKVGGYLGGMISSIGTFFSKFPMMMKFLGFVGTVLKRLVVPFLIVKDVVQSLFGDKNAQSRLVAGLGGGVAGAAAGAGALGIGAIPGALLGYGIGRELAPVEDAFIPSGKPTIMMTPGAPPMVTSSRDAVMAAPMGTFSGGGSGIDELVNQMKELIRVTKAGAERGMTAVVEVDSETIATAAFKHANPVHAV